MRPYAAFFALLLLSAAFAAGDASQDSMRAFCLTLLNQSGQQEAEQAAPPAPEAQNATNFSHSQQYFEALSGLVSANASIEKMRAAGLPTLRAQDTYSAALQWFEGQAALESAGGAADFGFSLEKIREVKSVERLSFSTSDELHALAERLGTVAQDVNLTRAIGLQKSAQAEFEDGRLEEASALVDSAYQEISDAETEAARSKTLVESARRNAETFLRENWQTIAAVLAAAAVLAFVFQKQIRRFLVTSRINALSSERTVLESMLRSLQKDYFERRKVSEMTYHVKTKKFGDLIRNINRQLPLLKEELKRI